MSEHENETADVTHAGETPEAQGGVEPAAAAPPFAAAGEAFTTWFNAKVRRLTNPAVMLGTKLAKVIELHEDGRLEVEIEIEAPEPERQFVAFDSSHLDQLVRKIAALGL